MFKIYLLLIRFGRCKRLKDFVCVELTATMKTHFKYCIKLLQDVTMRLLFAILKNINMLSSYLPCVSPVDDIIL